MARKTIKQLEEEIQTLTDQVTCLTDSAAEDERHWRDTFNMMSQTAEELDELASLSHAKDEAQHAVEAELNSKLDAARRILARVAKELGQPWDQVTEQSLINTLWALQLRRTTLERWVATARPVLGNVRRAAGFQTPLLFREWHRVTRLLSERHEIVSGYKPLGFYWRLFWRRLVGPSPSQTAPNQTTTATETPNS